MLTAVDSPFIRVCVVRADSDNRVCTRVHTGIFQFYKLPKQCTKTPSWHFSAAQAAPTESEHAKPPWIPTAGVGSGPCMTDRERHSDAPVAPAAVQHASPTFPHYDETVKNILCKDYG